MVGPAPVLVAGPSSETRKKADGMKYSLVELKASVAELWSLPSAPGLFVKMSRSIAELVGVVRASWPRSVSPPASIVEFITLLDRVERVGQRAGR